MAKYGIEKCTRDFVLITSTLGLATEGSIPAQDVERLLAGEGRADVLREEAQHKSFGVSGVPSFFFNGQPMFSGAVAPAMLANTIREMISSPS